MSYVDVYRFLENPEGCWRKMNVATNIHSLVKLWSWLLKLIKNSPYKEKS